MYKKCIDGVLFVDGRGFLLNLLPMVFHQSKML